ncbi:DUF2165 family protein [Pseudidiomarina insulisalsae]|uniref:DUF2165 domain-containing protein n=1 Tax=Pseudidiomarina insulisalsae TaxID=575789 RepID=A0A432YI07_9GAMM|nr:DUF2165 family protein [Pseudidiomarina insulisalsae]RUO60599.1 hypothetical protein CWI71_06985 [Pseudidiomarina insulisalsae]
MSLRWIKIILALLLGLMCIAYALQNLVNLAGAHAALSYVLGMQDHTYYPETFAFAVTHPTLTWLALSVVIALELLAGIILLTGSWRLFQARYLPAAGFQQAKYTTLVGAGVGIIVWFGLFQVFGGAFFQMWQTELGDASFDGSFVYLGSIALIALFINQAEPASH